MERCAAGDSHCASCRSEGVIRLNADIDGGFIGSVVVDERQDDDGCGTSRCPWIIRGQPGQVSSLSVANLSVTKHACIVVHIC